MTGMRGVLIKAVLVAAMATLGLTLKPAPAAAAALTCFAQGCVDTDVCELHTCPDSCPQVVCQYNSGCTGPQMMLVCLPYD